MTTLSGAVLGGAGCGCGERRELAAGAGMAGVLAQAALVSLRAAFRGLRPRQLLVSRPAAVAATAAVVTVLAVYGAG